MGGDDAREDTETAERLVRECLRRSPELDASDPTWHLRVLLASRRLDDSRDAEFEALLVDAPLRSAD